MHRVLKGMVAFMSRYEMMNSRWTRVLWDIYRILKGIHVTVRNDGFMVNSRFVSYVSRFERYGSVHVTSWNDDFMMNSHFCKLCNGRVTVWMIFFTVNLRFVSRVAVMLRCGHTKQRRLCTCFDVCAALGAAGIYPVSTAPLRGALARCARRFFVFFCFVGIRKKCLWKTKRECDGL